MQLLFSQRHLIEALRTRVFDNADYCKSGTYNSADPTHFERASARFWFEYGFTFEPATDLNDEPIKDLNGNVVLNDIPSPEVITVEYNDCTWGVDISFSTTVGTVSAYFDDDWRNVKADNYQPNSSSNKDLTDLKWELFSSIFLSILSAPPASQIIDT